MKPLFLASLTVFALLLFSLPASAADEDLDGFLAAWTAAEPEDSAAPMEDSAAPPADGDSARSWDFAFTLYLWLPSLEIDAIAEGEEVEAKKTSGDALAIDLEGAFTGRLEAWRGDFGIIVDLGMLSISDDLKLKGDGPAGVTRESEIGLRGLNAFLGGAWRFTGERMGVYPRSPGFYGDLIGGLRYYQLELSVERDGASDLDGDEAFLEPVIGIRGGYHFGRVFSLAARFEMGGFGIADLPDYDIVLELEARFRVTSWLDLDIGYQWKWLKLSTGSGSDEFGLDAAFAGPRLGLTILF